MMKPLITLAIAAVVLLSGCCSPNTVEIVNVGRNPIKVTMHVICSDRESARVAELIRADVAVYVAQGGDLSNYKASWWAWRDSNSQEISFLKRSAVPSLPDPHAHE